MSAIRLALLFVLTSLFTAQASEDLGYGGRSKIVFGFASVEEAFNSLSADPANKVREFNGWSIVSVDNENEKAVWSFAHQNHPAHPSVVKRFIVEHEGSLYMKTEASCGASKADCDKLMRAFLELNEKLKSSLK